MWSNVRTLLLALSHTFKKKDTVEYPDQMPYLAPRYRGRIVLTRDPDGEERCVACNLCAAVCPADCIDVTKQETEAGRWQAATFRINFARCIFCGFCEEACPVSAIFMGKDYELAVYSKNDFVWDKTDLLVQPASQPAAQRA